jgi:hypothetical protein
LPFLQFDDFASLYKNALRIGRASVLWTCTAKPIPTLTALFIMIAYFAKGSKKMIYLHDLCLYGSITLENWQSGGAFFFVYSGVEIGGG